MIAAVAYRRSVRDKEREQAGQIACWTSDDGTASPRKLYIFNHSDKPVYALKIQPFEAPEFTTPKLDGNSEMKVDIPAYEKEKLRRTRMMRIRAAVIFTAEYTWDRYNEEPFPKMTFRDSVEQWWNRDRDGNLKRKSKNFIQSPAQAIYVFDKLVAYAPPDGKTSPWWLGRKKVERPQVETLAAFKKRIRQAEQDSKDVDK